MTLFKEELRMAKVQSMSMEDFMNGKEWTSKKTFNTLIEPITLLNHEQKEVTFPLEKPTVFFFITTYK
jgi:hypothetical protein